MSRIQKLSSNVAAYFLGTAVLLTLFFSLWRLILLVLTYDMATSVPSEVLAGSFITGLRFDFSIACYISMTLTLLGMLPWVDISRVKIVRSVNVSLLYLFVAGAFLLHLGDIEFFKFFNARLSGAALLWKESPEYMAELIWETYPIGRYVLLYSTMMAGFIYVSNKLRRWQLDSKRQSSVLTNTIWLLVLLAVMGVGSRGRIEGRAPIRWGVAYFSSFDYANLLALNPTFTFTRDAIYDAGSKTHVRELMASIHDPEAESITRRLLGIDSDDTGKIVREVRFEKENPTPPNVVLVIMESFGNTRIGTLDNRWPYDLSPSFDSIASRGLLFTNVYSGGKHTFGGLVSTGYGYPHLFGDLVMKTVIGQNYFWGLPQILRQHGYHTQFYTTHDPHFDNMQGFFMANGVDRVYSLDDYGIGEELSVTGVPDHIMFDYAVERLREIADQPFCSILLTGSNHGPWVLPDVPFSKLPETEERAYELNALVYSDWSLGQFVRQLEADSAFDNTIVVVTSDNGNRFEPQSDMDLTQYHIPFLIYRVGKDKGTVGRFDILGSQLDIVATVMGQLELNYDNYTFGKDLLDTSASGVPFAHFTEWYHIGYVEGDFYGITRINGPQSLYRLTDLSNDLADSLPELAGLYRQKALAIYQSAYHNLFRPLSGDTTATEVSRTD